MKKTLILYYSLGGNTRRVAEMLHRQLGADIAEIRAKTPYSGDYNDIVQQGKKEVDKVFLPEIHSISPSPSPYDQIILGSPVWWYTFAPAMHTALKSQN
ncbi:flavodoxin [Guopingia tenuis]|uniref:flavodoxin n=1 Tax=Guopingia tenuis TaxID=2763656 RepID=UPI0020163DD1|nr:flavodoxin [Guopingia tenuis]